LKQQKYPSSVIKVGAVLYDVSAYYYEGKTSVDVDEWHVKSIRKKRGSQTKRGRDVPEYLKNDVVKVTDIGRMTDSTFSTGSFGSNTTTVRTDKGTYLVNGVFQATLDNPLVIELRGDDKMWLCDHRQEQCLSLSN
jgi:hypothetical protein